jgi:spermidine synthase
MILGDGRNHLRLTDRRYDVIVSEPSNVWNSGIGALMSSEFFALARRGLRPEGILCSWIQGYSLSPEALRSVLAAAQTAFPRVSLWMGGWGDLLIVAGDASLDIDVARLLERGREPEFAALLREIHCPDLLSLVSHNLMAGDAVANYVAGMAPNTDDNNYLEFAAPKLLYRETMAELFGGLHAAAGGTETWLAGPGAEELAREIPRLRRARALESEGRLALREERGVEGLRALEEAHRLHPTEPTIAKFLALAVVSRGASLRRRGELAESVEHFLRAADLAPGASEPFAELARTYADAGQPEPALEAIEEAIRRQPRDPDLTTSRASLLVRMRDFKGAERDARAALERDVWIHDAYAALGEALEGRGRAEEADSVYRAGLARFPDSPELLSRQRKVHAAERKRTGP